MHVLLLVVSLVSLVQSPAFAVDSPKPKSRWSLSDWLDTRDRMRMMDLWLVMNSQSPYEFFLEGDYQFATLNSAPSAGWRASFAAYAHIFGLQAEYEMVPQYSKFGAQFNFRIFGPRAQGTNITLHLGLRNQTETVGTFRNGYLGIGVTLYMTQFFGIEGFYRWNLGAAAVPVADTIAGNRLEGTAFIEFNFFRVFGTYFIESDTRTTGAVPTSWVRSGAIAGGKFFF